MSDVLKDAPDARATSPGGPATETGGPAAPWPAPLRISPKLVVLGGAGLAVVALAMFLAVDIIDIAGLGDRLEPRTMWRILYENGRPVEWIQWIALGATAVGAGYVSGRATAQGDADAGRFFLLFGAGVTLMLIEDAGDVRHVLSAGVRRAFGEDIVGLPYRVVSDVPYMVLLAALPIYALVRYGPALWRATSVRRYLVLGYGLYAFVGATNGFRHLGDAYERVGARIDEWFLGGRFPPAHDMSQDRAHFMLLDGPYEETLELLAAACFLAIVLAYARHLRRRSSPERVTRTSSPRD